MLLKNSKTNKMMFSINVLLKLQNISTLQYLVGPYYTGPELTQVVIFQMFTVKLWWTNI